MANNISDPRNGSDTLSTEVEIDNPSLLLQLTGPNAGHLRILQSEYDVATGIRGNVIHLRGRRNNVRNAERALLEIVGVLEKNGPGVDVHQGMRTLKNHPDVRLDDVVSDVILSTPRKTITAKGVPQQRYVQAMRQFDVVFGIGPAGTGKTYLAMAMAVKALLEKRVKRIILARPAVEAGEKLGFLPGDLAEKVNPYLRPLYDALHDMMEVERAQTLVERGVIEVAPLAFMRGRTLNDSFVILDEAQNATVEQMRMFLTRLGFGSKAVVTGDVTQVDLPNNTQSGLSDAVRLLTNVDGISISWFSDADVVRHPLVARIVRAYEGRDQERKGNRNGPKSATESIVEALDAPPPTAPGDQKK